MFAVHCKRRIPREGPVNEIKIFKPVNLAMRSCKGMSSAPFHYVFLIMFFCKMLSGLSLLKWRKEKMFKVMGQIQWTAAPLLHAVLQHKMLRKIFFSLIIVSFSTNTECVSPIKQISPIKPSQHIPIQFFIPLASSLRTPHKASVNLILNSG